MFGLVGIGQPWEYHLTTEQEPTEGPGTSREQHFEMNLLPTSSLFELEKKSPSYPIPTLSSTTAPRRLCYSPQESPHIHRSELPGKQYLCSSQCL